MNWKQAKNTEDNIYNLPGDWLKIEYFEALNILFRVENSLRIFVYIILKNEFQDKWISLSITSDDDEKSTISAISKKRLSQDKNFAYLGYILNSPLLHLTSGELIRMITSDAYWKLFKGYFLGSREIIRNKLDEIGNVRNSLAHFRPLKKGDIELIKQNSIHTLTEIERTLNDFVSCPDTVPTNTEEDWYTELAMLSTEDCKLSFKQSKKEAWIKVILTFNIATVMSENYYSSYVASKLNLRTDRILIDFPELAKHTICVTEVLPSTNTSKPANDDMEKEVRFTFSRLCVQKNYISIKSQLEKVLLTISKEVELIKKDNLARGRLIGIVECFYRKSEGVHLFFLEEQPFKTEFDEESPVEFWGSLNHSSRNFITDTEKYPWMPINISENKELPF